MVSIRIGSDETALSSVRHLFGGRTISVSPTDSSGSDPDTNLQAVVISRNGRFLFPWETFGKILWRVSGFPFVFIDPIDSETG
jgi:hypothetical protein